MRKRRKRYSPEYKRQAVEQLKSGRHVMELAKELGIPATTLNQWLTKADGAAEAALIVETAEEELRRLRRENERLRMERDFLKKAAAFFAKEENK
jgi:transposase